MSFNFNPRCCFCSKNVFRWTITYLLRQNQFCEKRQNSVNANGTNLSSSKFKEIKNEAKKYIEELSFFVPKIDTLLLPRFTKMLVGLDQYSFAFSSKKALHLLTPKRLIVAKDMNIFGESFFIPRFDDSNILVTENFEVRNICLGSETTKFVCQKLFDSIYTKQLIIKAKIIVLRAMEFTPEIFYQPLSPHLFKLKCYKVTFTTLLNPIDFVEKLPNIETFIFSDTHYSYFWNTQRRDKFETLPINCKAFEEFCVPFKCLDLTLESFSAVVKKWSKNQRKVLAYTYDTDAEFLNFSTDTHIQVLYEFLMEINLS